MIDSIVNFVADEKSHAMLLFVGGFSEAKDIAKRATDEIKITSESYVQELLDVDTARTIRDRSLMKTESGSKRIIYIAFEKIHPESQNTLLKTLEEPTQGLYFVIISATQNILPTIQSRMSVIVSSGSTAYEMWAKKFLRSTYKARLDEVKSVTGEDEYDLKSRLNAILKQLPVDSEFSDGRSYLVECLSYSEGKGVSAKMILESLSLILPIKT